MHSRTLLAATVAAVLSMTATDRAAADALTLPDPTTVPTVTYGNFISYSLPLLDLVLNTNQFDISSALGTIRKVDVIVGTGANNGQFPVNDAISADNPLGFPNCGGPCTFSGT